MDEIEWKLKPLRERIGAEHGPKHLEVFKEALTSFVKKRAISEFYADEINEIFNDALPEEEPVEKMKCIMMSFFADEKFQERAYVIRLAYFKAEAHLFSFAQSLHSTSDILAKIIHYALNLENSDAYITLNGLKGRKKALSEDLKRAISTTINDGSYKYLADFTNKIKHHALIKSAVPMQIIEGVEWQPIKIKSFQFRNRSHPDKLLSEFIKNDFDSITRNYLRVGIALNEQLRLN